MADLKVDVDFTGKGAEQLKGEFSKINMSAKELEKELKALATDYGKLVGQMTVLKRAGLENTTEFKALKTQADLLSKEIKTLGTQYQNTSEKTNLFRTKAVNLGADLTILSFGVKSVVEDISALSDEANKTTPSISKMAGSIGTASLSALAMVPALKALGSGLAPLVAMFGAGAAGIATFSAAIVGSIAVITVTLGGFVKAILQAHVTWEAFSKLFSGENVFDIWANATKELTFGMIDFTGSVDDATDAVIELGNAFIWMQQQVNTAVDINRKKFLGSEQGGVILFEKFTKGQKLSIEELNAVERELNNTRQKTTDPKLIAEINKQSDAIKKQREEYDGLGRTIKNTRNSGKTTNKKEEVVSKDGTIDYKKNAMAWLALQNVIDVSTLEAKTVEMPITVLRQRVVEETLLMQEALAGFAESSVMAMGAFFSSFVPPQNALSPLQQMLKTILMNAISTAEGLLFAGGAASFFKAIFTSGFSLLSDVPWKIAGFAALQVAKGFIGAFADGTRPVSQGGVALVGERGPELIYMNKGMGVMNNVDTRAYMNRGGGTQNSETGVYISADVAGMLKVHEKNARDLRQFKKWKRF